MRHFALGSVLLLASAQLALAATINVTVGGSAGLKFVPDTVNANVGDVILFTFLQKNHTVTQSTLASPCIRSSSGFDSGFKPVPADQTSGFPMANLTVTSAEPIWAYCRQGTHCQSGMVFSVNPGTQLATFRANAAASGSSPPPTVSSATTPVPTTSAVPSSTDHRVIVGGANILTFTPSNITAQPGDTITFEFRQKNHTVTSSTFDAPCRPNGAFDSGFKPTDGSSSFPTYTLLVNDTKPIWAYCKQGTHCASGMVFAANAVETSNKSFAAFLDKAKSPTDSSTPYGTGAAWRPSVGSPLMAVVLAISAAGWLL
jgi:plastocyanin